MQSYFTKGANSTLQLNRGTNLSYQSTGVVIYESTEIDSWHIGDFISAEYIINAEYGLNERETIHATLVAMPGQSSITVYGRTSLTRPLINVRADATNSIASLIVQPASLGVQGSIISFFANYARANLPLSPQNAPATANSCSWNSSIGAVTSLSITVPTAFVVGPILVGQRVIGNNIPMMATVLSYDANTQTLVIGDFEPTTFSAASNVSLRFETGINQLSNSFQTLQPSKSFRTIMVPRQDSINATTETDHLGFIPGAGLEILTDSANKEITINSFGVTRLEVTGQPSIDSVNTGLRKFKFTEGDKINLITNPSTNELTISSLGIAYSTDDAQTTTSTNIDFSGANGIVTSSINGSIIITDTTTAYNKFTDGTILAQATTNSDTFKFRSGDGISLTVANNDITHGDNLLIANSGVLSIGGTTGAIDADSLVDIVNTSANNVELTPGSKINAMVYFMSSS